MKAASRVTLCLPEPPTPTNNPCPPGWFKILDTLQRCSIAKENKTKSMGLVVEELNP